MDSKKLTLLTVSSLEKIFPDEPFQPQAEYTGADMLLNERFSFQAAYCWEGPLTFKAGIQLSGTLADDVIIRQVGLAPSELPIFPDGDDFVLRTTPGLYPDPLYSGISDITLLPGQWRSLWITVPAECSPAFRFLRSYNHRYRRKRHSPQQLYFCSGSPECPPSGADSHPYRMVSYGLYCRLV